MITYIKGRLIEKSPTKIIVESNGIGYEINISLNTYEKIPDDDRGGVPRRPRRVRRGELHRRHRRRGYS